MATKEQKLPDHAKLDLEPVHTSISHLREFDQTVNLSMSERTLAITDQATFDKASAMLSQARDMLDLLKNEEQKFRKPHNQALKAVSEWFKPSKDSLERVISALNGKMSEWTLAEARRREEEQRAAEEAARKERERLEKQAARAEAKGQEEKAAELQERALEVVPEVVPQKVAAKHTTTVMVHRGRVTDKIAFIKAIAAGQIPDALVDVNESRLNSIAQQSEGGFEWPGVEWYKEAQFRRR